jgi:hypothetical protein
MTAAIQGNDCHIRASVFFDSKVTVLVWIV